MPSNSRERHLRRLDRFASKIDAALLADRIRLTSNRGERSSR